MDKVDEDYLKEILNPAQPSADSSKVADVTIKESSLTIEQIMVNMCKLWQPSN